MAVGVIIAYPLARDLVQSLQRFQERRSAFEGGCIVFGALGIATGRCDSELVPANGSVSATPAADADVIVVGTAGIPSLVADNTLSWFDILSRRESTLPCQSAGILSDPSQFSQDALRFAWSIAVLAGGLSLSQGRAIFAWNFREGTLSTGLVVRQSTSNSVNQRLTVSIIQRVLRLANLYLPFLAFIARVFSKISDSGIHGIEGTHHAWGAYHARLAWCSSVLTVSASGLWDCALLCSISGLLFNSYVSAASALALIPENNVTV